MSGRRDLSTRSSVLRFHAVDSPQELAARGRLARIERTLERERRQALLREIEQNRSLAERSRVRKIAAAIAALSLYAIAAALWLAA